MNVDAFHFGAHGSLIGPTLQYRLSVANSPLGVATSDNRVRPDGRRGRPTRPQRATPVLKSSKRNRI